LAAEVMGNAPCLTIYMSVIILNHARASTPLLDG
jgi:hypothetical protein